jgi:hypothetical protein
MCTKSFFANGTAFPSSSSSQNYFLSIVLVWKKCCWLIKAAAKTQATKIILARNVVPFLLETASSSTVDVGLRSSFP